MSEPKARPKKAHEDFALNKVLWSFFHGSDTPAAVCNKELVIVEANKAFCLQFEALAGRSLSDINLCDIFSASPTLRKDLENVGQATVRLPGERSVVANAAPTGELLLVTFEAGLVGARLAEARRLLEEQGRVQEICHLLSVLLTEEDLVGVVAQGLRQLLPDKCFAIRVVSTPDGRLTCLYAEGDLLPDEHEVLTLQRSMLSRTNLPPNPQAKEWITVSEAYHLIFEGTETGFGVPLSSGDQLVGMITVEGLSSQFADMESDERLVLSLANHLSIALRNARLLRESRYLRGYLEKLIDNANALIMVMDGQKRVSVFNRAFQELSGFTREEVIGEAFMDLLAEEDRPSIEHIFELAMEGRTATNVEASVMARDGRRIRVAFNAAGILDSDGRVESVIAIGNDLTRIWELKRQIIQAEKLASLGQLSAAVVHELNNPLTSITVYAEYMRDRLSELGSDKDVEKAARILESADRILNFTRRLVTYARPSDERPSRLDLRNVIEHSAQLCDHIIQKRKVRFNIEWNDKIPRILGNQGSLHQVFINLITNACQAVEIEGTISLSGHLMDNLVEVRLRDNGKGMAPEVSARIFEPFFSTKAPGKGTGLGLSIVQEIVRSHGGTIAVESEPGKGSLFYIRLPALSDEI